MSVSVSLSVVVLGLLEGVLGIFAYGAADADAASEYCCFGTDGVGSA